MSSQVYIEVNGEDVTQRVVYASAVFESQQNAIPGTFEVTLKDPDRDYDPPDTGTTIFLDLDGTRHFGGYVTQITRKFALPVDELPSDARMWVLRGVDWNILFDKRVTRRPANYLRHLPVFHGDQFDGELITYFAENYIDLPLGLDVSSFVDNIVTPFFSEDPDTLADRAGGWKQQGTIWREQIELLQQWSGAVFYISPSFELHYHAIENINADFGFSDQPNGTSTIGVRDVTATERGGPQMTNDALVWGGSEWSEDVIFGRSENATSISTHGRWQKAEHHFGEDGYKLTTQWRADLITEGGATVTGAGFNPGEAFPQYDLNVTWFGENQPSGQQILSGQLVSTELTTFGAPFNPMVLPMRSIRITFPGVDPSGFGHVQLTGSMGLALTDPFSIWQHLRNLRRQRNPVVSVALDDTVRSTYGGFGQFTPELVSGNIYRLPNTIGYIANTTQVYLDGVLQSRGADYDELDPVAGMIEFTSSPGAADIFVVVRTS
jgi:hypothetical protein